MDTYEIYNYDIIRLKYEINLNEENLNQNKYAYLRKAFPMKNVSG